MAYDEKLAERVRALFANEPGVTEHKNFGGVGFMIHGNVAVAVTNDDLMVRIDPAQYDSVSIKPHARPYAQKGRPMRGWLLISPEGTRTKRGLEAWVARGTAFARSLPAK